MAAFNGGGVGGVGPKKFDASMEELKSLIGDVLTRLDVMDSKIDTVQSLSNDSAYYIKAIYNGDSIPDWIEDLKTNKKNSDTYKSPDRMQKLYTNPNVCVDTTINNIVFDYVIDNSLNVGNFLEGCIGSVSGVTWSSLSTLDLLCKSSEAFTAFANNNAAVSAIFNSTKGAKLANAIIDNYSITESIFFASSIMTNKYKSGTQYIGTEATTITNTMILYYTDGDSYSKTRNVTLTYLDGSTYTYDHTNWHTINRFVKKMELTDSTSGGKANWTGTNYFSLNPYKGTLQYS